MWRPIAMCLAVGWMVGCGGAGEPEPEPRTPQYASEEGHSVSSPFRESGPPEWDGTPCNGSGTMVDIDGKGYFLPSECEPDYIEKGTPATEINPPMDSGWAI